MLRGYGPVNGIDDFEKIFLAATLDFLHDDNALLAILLHRKGRSAIRQEAGMAALHRSLDILRVDIHASEYDQVLNPSRDEQLPILKKSEIARSQERPLA